MDITVDANLVFSETTVKIPDPVNDTDGVNKRSLVSKIGEYISINTLGANITQGATITSITLSNPASKHEYESGNTVRIIKKDTGEYQDFVVSDDIASGSTLLSINSDTANYNFNVGDYIYVILNDITSAANSGNGFDELFIIDNTLNYWLYVQDVVLKTSDTVGDGATAGVVFDEFGIRNYTSSSTTPTIDINSDGSLSQLYVNISDKGTAASPAIRFSGDVDTGIFSSGDDTLDLVTGGLSRLTIDASGNLNIPGTATIGNINLSGVLTGGSAGFTGQVLGSPFLAGTNGSAGAPVYTRDGDTDTGIYFPTLDEIGISVSSTQQLHITVTDTTVNNTLNTNKIIASDAIETINGGLTNLAIRPSSDTDTGVYFVNPGGLYLVSNGAQTAGFLVNNINLYKDVYMQGIANFNTGKVFFADASSNPSLSGQLWRNNTKLYYHNGTTASPLATEDWVTSAIAKAVVIRAKTGTWSNNETILLFNANNNTSGTLTNIIVSVDSADSTNQWTITIENVNSGATAVGYLAPNALYTDFGAASLTVSNLDRIVAKISTGSTSPTPPSGFIITISIE